MQRETTNSRLIKRYFEILRELRGFRLSNFPKEVLPAPKQAIKQALTSQMKETAEGKERLELALSALDLFEEESLTSTSSDFIGKLITVPTIITLIYTIWLGLRGESWLWTTSIILIPLTVGGNLIWKFAGKPKSFLILLVYLSLETVALGLTGVVAIKLAFLSGFWGLIQSIAKMDWSGIIFALIAIFLGYHMCKYTNKIFLFLR